MQKSARFDGVSPAWHTHVTPTCPVPRSRAGPVPRGPCSLPAALPSPALTEELLSDFLQYAFLPLSVLHINRGLQSVRTCAWLVLGVLCVRVIRTAVCSFWSCILIAV